MEHPIAPETWRAIGITITCGAFFIGAAIRWHRTWARKNDHYSEMACEWCERTDDGSCNNPNCPLPGEIPYYAPNIDE